MPKLFQKYAKHGLILVAVLIECVVLLSTTSAPLTAQARAPRVQPFTIEIPAIKLKLLVAKAPFRNGTWDFRRIIYKAGYLDKRYLPGSGNNVVIGAHSELAWRRPGPFFHLSDVKVGDQVVVNYAGKRYVYQVSTIYQVDPTNLQPIAQTDHEVLTLLTCSDYLNGDYRQRLVVRAELQP